MRFIGSMPIFLPAIHAGNKCFYEPGIVQSKTKCDESNLVGHKVLRIESLIGRARHLRPATPRNSVSKAKFIKNYSISCMLHTYLFYIPALSKFWLNVLVHRHQDAGEMQRVTVSTRSSCTPTYVLPNRQTHTSTIKIKNANTSKSAQFEISLEPHHRKRCCR
jgi:hypothetical protein